jgi:hypothetical protein
MNRHREKAMHGYRAYLIGPDGHIEKRVDLFCEDDEAAKDRAEKLVDGHDVELWDKGRQLATFKQRQ